MNEKLSEQTIKYVREAQDFLSGVCETALDFMKSEVPHAPELMHEYIMAMHAIDRYLEQVSDEEEAVRLYTGLINKMNAWSEENASPCNDTECLSCSEIPVDMTQN